MDVKRIGSVLVVGLVLLSAVVVLTGTVAAERYDVKFYGYITDEGGKAMAGADVDIKLAYGGSEYVWSATTNEVGYYEVKKKFDSADIRTKRTYQMMINGGLAGEEVLIAKRGGYSDGDFTWHPEHLCYWSYQWNRYEYVIPEFSTIAIPIASILGLLFFFNRRKHRK